MESSFSSSKVAVTSQHVREADTLDGAVSVPQVLSGVKEATIRQEVEEGGESCSLHSVAGDHETPPSQHRAVETYGLQVDSFNPNDYRVHGENSQSMSSAELEVFVANGDRVEREHAATIELELSSSSHFNEAERYCVTEDTIRQPLTEESSAAHEVHVAACPENELVLTSATRSLADAIPLAMRSPFIPDEGEAETAQRVVPQKLEEHSLMVDEEEPQPTIQQSVMQGSLHTITVQTKRSEKVFSESQTRSSEVAEEEDVAIGRPTNFTALSNSSSPLPEGKRPNSSSSEESPLLSARTQTAIPIAGPNTAAAASPRIQSPSQHLGDAIRISKSMSNHTVGATSSIHPSLYSASSLHNSLSDAEKDCALQIYLDVEGIRQDNIADVLSQYFHIPTPLPLDVNAYFPADALNRSEGPSNLPFNFPDGSQEAEEVAASPSLSSASLGKPPRPKTELGGNPPAVTAGGTLMEPIAWLDLLSDLGAAVQWQFAAAVSSPPPALHVNGALPTLMAEGGAPPVSVDQETARNSDAVQQPQRHSSRTASSSSTFSWGEAINAAAAATSANPLQQGGDLLGRASGAAVQNAASPQCQREGFSSSATVDSSPVLRQQTVQPQDGSVAPTTPQPQPGSPVRRSDSTASTLSNPLNYYEVLRDEGSSSAHSLRVGGHGSGSPAGSGVAVVRVYSMPEYFPPASLGDSSSESKDHHDVERTAVKRPSFADLVCRNSGHFEEHVAAAAAGAAAVTGRENGVEGKHRERDASAAHPSIRPSTSEDVARALLTTLFVQLGAAEHRRAIRPDELNATAGGAGSAIQRRSTSRESTTFSHRRSVESSASNASALQSNTLLGLTVKDFESALQHLANDRSSSALTLNGSPSSPTSPHYNGISPTNTAVPFRQPQTPLPPKPFTSAVAKLIHSVGSTSNAFSHPKVSGKADSSDERGSPHTSSGRPTSMAVPEGTEEPMCPPTMPYIQPKGSVALAALTAERDANAEGEPYMDWYQFRTVVMDELDAVHGCVTKMLESQSLTRGIGNTGSKALRRDSAWLQVPPRPPVLCLTLAGIAPTDMTHFAGAEMTQYLRSVEVIKRCVRMLLKELAERQEERKRLKEEQAKSVSPAERKRRQALRYGNQYANVKPRYMQPPKLNDIALSIIARAKARRLLDELHRRTVPVNRKEIYLRAAIDAKPLKPSEMGECLDEVLRHLNRPSPSFQADQGGGVAARSISAASEADPDALDTHTFLQLLERDKPSPVPRTISLVRARNAKRQKEATTRLSTPMCNPRWYTTMEKRWEESRRRREVRHCSTAREDAQRDDDYMIQSADRHRGEQSGFSSQQRNDHRRQRQEHVNGSTSQKRTVSRDPVSYRSGSATPLKNSRMQGSTATVTRGCSSTTPVVEQTFNHETAASPNAVKDAAASRLVRPASSSFHSNFSIPATPIAPTQRTGKRPPSQKQPASGRRREKTSSSAGRDRDVPVRQIPRSSSPYHRLHHHLRVRRRKDSENSSQMSFSTTSFSSREGSRSSSRKNSRPPSGEPPAAHEGSRQRPQRKRSADERLLHSVASASQRSLPPRAPVAGGEGGKGTTECRDASVHTPNRTPHLHGGTPSTGLSTPTRKVAKSQSDSSQLFGRAAATPIGRAGSARTNSSVPQSASVTSALFHLTPTQQSERERQRRRTPLSSALPPTAPHLSKGTSPYAMASTMLWRRPTPSNRSRQGASTGTWDQHGSEPTQGSSVRMEMLLEEDEELMNDLGGAGHRLPFRMYQTIDDLAAVEARHQARAQSKGHHYDALKEHHLILRKVLEESADTLLSRSIDKKRVGEVNSEEHRWEKLQPYREKSVKKTMGSGGRSSPTRPSRSKKEKKMATSSSGHPHRHSPGPRRDPCSLRGTPSRQRGLHRDPRQHAEHHQHKRELNDEERRGGSRAEDDEHYRPYSKDPHVRRPRRQLHPPPPQSSSSSTSSITHLELEAEEKEEEPPNDSSGTTLQQKKPEAFYISENDSEEEDPSDALVERGVGSGTRSSHRTTTHSEDGGEPENPIFAKFHHTPPSSARGEPKTAPPPLEQSSKARQSQRKTTRRSETKEEKPCRHTTKRTNGSVDEALSRLSADSSDRVIVQTPRADGLSQGINEAAAGVEPVLRSPAPAVKRRSTNGGSEGSMHSNETTSSAEFPGHALRETATPDIPTAQPIMSPDKPPPHPSRKCSTSTIGSQGSFSSSGPSRRVNYNGRTPKLCRPGSASPYGTPSEIQYNSSGTTTTMPSGGSPRRGRLQLGGH